MASREWKHDTQRFKNMKVEVDLWLESPWTPVFKCMFKVKPTAQAEIYFDEDIPDFQFWLANNIFGLKILKKSVEDIIPSDWRYHMTTYGKEYNPKQIKNFGKKHDFQVDFHIMSPEIFENANDWKGLKKQVQLMSTKISKMAIFQTTAMLEFTA
jgi:hypothetical protein